MEQNKKVGWVLVVVAVFGYFLYFAAVKAATSDKGRPVIAKVDSDEEANPEDKDQPIIRAMMAVSTFKKQLLNPDSLKIVEAYRMGDDSVCIGYRAQNALGGYGAGRMVWIDGDYWFVEGEKDFTLAWKQKCTNGKPIADVTSYIRASK